MPNGYPMPDAGQVERINRAYSALPELPLQKHPAQIRNFLRALMKEEPLAVNGEEGRKPIEIITAIYEAAATHRPVDLPLTKEDRFYTLEGKVSNLPIYHEKTYSVETTEAQTITFPKG